MAVCSEYRIPHSEYLAWSEADQAKAVAYLTHKAEKCTLCGTAEWEWDPEQGGTRFAYEPVEKVCPGCYAKHGQGSDQPGAYITLEPTNTRESARRHLAQRAAHLARQRQVAEQRAAAKRIREARVTGAAGIEVVERG